MALRILSGTFRNFSFQNLKIRNEIRSSIKYAEKSNCFLQPTIQSTDYIRSIGFLNKISGAELWKGCTSVSNAGKKRGRGRLAGKGLTKDLNQGQLIGFGRQKLILPGLNAPVKRGTDIVKQERGVDDPSWAEKLYNLRDMNRTRKRLKLNHMERGYSGTKLAGRSVGAPDSIGDFHFDGFDSRCIEMKIVNVMRGNLGRLRRHSTFIITGNGQGVAGFALGKSSDPKAAIRKAKNRAAQKLMHFELCDGHTIHHDFFTQFGYTKIYVYKMPKGYGIQTHRIIKTICQLVGIKDIRAKIEGSTNPQSIVKAFFVGLLQQKTHQQLAEEKKLFLVEFAENRAFFPRIVGIPSYCRTVDEIPKNENLDFKQHVLQGKVILKRRKPGLPCEKLPSYQTYLIRAEKRRSFPAIKFYLRTKYGTLRSFLTDKYPEAHSFDRDRY